MAKHIDDLVLCESPDGWSLHAPGATDDEIASGDALYLAVGVGAPSAEDYLSAARKLAPEAAKVVAVDGGFLAFATHDEHRSWANQR